MESFLGVAVLAEKREQMWTGWSSLVWVPASNSKQGIYTQYSKIKQLQGNPYTWENREVYEDHTKYKILPRYL